MKLLISLLLGICSACCCFAQTDTTIPEMVNTSRRLRQLMQSDPHRPIYHFVSPEGHCMPFDLNGGIYWKGNIIWVNIGAQYFIGDFANDRFSIQQHGRMNCRWYFFAPNIAG